MNTKLGVRGFGGLGAAFKPPPAPAAVPQATGPAISGIPGQPQINTSITPQPIYTPTQTQYAKNQARADLSAQGNLRTLLHGNDTPGVSRSAGSVAAVLPQMAQIRAQNAGLMQSIPFQDQQANLANILSGQQARSNEWFGLGGAYNTMNQNALNNQYSQQQWLLGLLGNLGAF